MDSAYRIFPASLRRSTRIAGIALGLVFSVCAEAGAGGGAADPEIVEARRRMIDFALQNPGSSAERMKQEFEKTIGAAESRAQDKAAGPKVPASLRKKKARASGASTLRLREGADGKLRAVPLDGVDSGAGTAERSRVGEGEDPGRKKSRSTAPAEDPSPLPFTGPRSLDFRPEPSPSPKTSPSASF